MIPMTQSMSIAGFAYIPGAGSRPAHIIDSAREFRRFQIGPPLVHCLEVHIAEHRWLRTWIAI